MRLVSIKIVAEFLMIKQSTLYSWVHKGSIPFHKLNGLIRFDMDEIEAWVKSSKQQPSDNISIKKQPTNNIDNVVRNAIDEVKGNRYNSSNGKPGQIKVSGRRFNGTV
jgi:excisionase family DNA binding protein